MIDLNELKIFTQIVASGSFTAAAEYLGLTKSTVSRKLAGLEHRLGARLLTRSTRQLHLTEPGEALYQRCRRILADLEEAELAVSSTQEIVTGHLNLVIPIEVGQLVMGRVIGEYLQKYPQVTIHAELTNRHVDMVAENIDLLFQLGTGKESSLVARRVSSSSAMLVASPAYVRRHGKVTQPRDLVHHNCLVGQMILWTFTRQGEEVSIKPSGVFVTNNVTCIREAAVSGLGVARLPLFLIEAQLQRGELVPLMPDWRTADAHIYALYPNRRYLPQNVKTFLDYSAQQLARSWG